MARTLIGRDVELAALEQVVADAARGAPAAAVVSGDAGVGKTRKLTLINCSYQLVLFLAMSLVIWLV